MRRADHPSNPSKQLTKPTGPTKQVARPQNSKPFFPEDKEGNIIPGEYDTSVGKVKVQKLEPAKAYDVVSMARAMNKDFAPQLKTLFDPEREAVMDAIKTGVYISWRPIDPPYDKQDCQRVSVTSRCFCGHNLSQHDKFTGSEAVLRCRQTGCTCKVFNFVPSRPEEAGEFWLLRRRDFDPKTYRAKCQCKHTHEEHQAHPPPHRCVTKGCGCSFFTSAFVCAACDQHWHRHHTVLETEKERRQAGRPVGEEWLPFAELPDLCKIALTGEDNPSVETLADALPPSMRQRQIGEASGISNDSPFPAARQQNSKGVGGARFASGGSKANR